MIFYFSLILMIVCTALGQIYYKLFFREMKKKYIVLALIFFITTPYLNYEALRGLSLDFVCIFSALIFVLVQVLSNIVLKEKQTKIQLMGTISIILGLLVYSI